MASVAPAAASLATHKKRQRREAKIREQYDRISAALLNTDSTKFAARNPTRVIPAVPGFETLSKTEIKKDCKEIERGSMFQYRDQVLDKEEELLQGVERSFHPPCNPESTLLKTYYRLRQWSQDPELKNKEIASWQGKCAEIRLTRAQLEQETTAWLAAFDIQRKVLTDALRDVHDENKKVKRQSKQLEELCHAECASAPTSAGTGSTSKCVGQVPASSHREVLEEIERREEEAELKVEDFSLAAQSAGLTLVLPKASLSAAVHAQLFPEPVAPAIKVEVSDKATTGDEAKSRHSAAVENADELPSVATRRVMMAMSSFDDQLRITESFSDFLELDGSFFEADHDLALLQAIVVKKTGDAKADSDASPADRDEALRLFGQLRSAADWATYVLSALDPTGLQGGRKKRRTGGQEPLFLLANARSRVERGPRVLYSPISTFEDRYVAAEVADAPNAAPLVALVPKEVAAAENAFMEQCTAHSSIVSMATEVVHMQAEVVELNKLLLEATSSRHKAEALMKQVAHEDEAERQRIRQELVYYGLSSATEHEKASGEASVMEAAVALAQAMTEPPKKSSNSRRSSGGSRAAAAAAATVATNEDNASEVLSQSRTSTSSPVPDREPATVAAKRKSAGQPDAVPMVTGKRRR